MALVNQQSEPNPAIERRRLCALNDLSADMPKRIIIDDLKLSVSSINGAVYAVNDMCTHANYSLSEGHVNPEELTIECWKHGAEFCLVSGKALTLPATRPLNTFATEIESGEVFVYIPKKGQQ